MAQNTLAIEGLSPRIGATEAFSAQGPGVASEARVAREMTTQGLSAPAGDAKQAATTFSDILRKSVEEVNLHQHQADHAIKELVAGRTKNIHETMLAVERADTSLKLMMQVRNKVLDAYREIMRMQV
jgi:flagellar hook-basal body complex protein FliE